MCLNIVNPPGKLKRYEGKIVTGYKIGVVSSGGQGGRLLTTPFLRAKFQFGVWAKDSSRGWIAWPAISRHRYPKGFHVYANKADARKGCYSGEAVVQCECRKVVASGSEGISNVLVVRELRPVREVWRRKRPL